MRSCIVTGFGTFPGVPKNPCVELLNRLRDTPPIGVDLITSILPVSFDRSILELKQIIKDTEKNLPRIHIGCSKKTAELVLERTAVNVRQSSIPDIDGEYYDVPKSISAHAINQQCSTKIDIQFLKVKLTEQGVPVKISNDAGKYVCNNVYWTSLQFDSSPTLFVHIPIIFGKELDTIELGIRILISQMLIFRH